MKTLHSAPSLSAVATGQIHNFFSAYHLHQALEQLDVLLTWAGKQNWYSKKPPAHLMFFTQHLKNLCTASEIIHFTVSRNLDAILFSESDVQKEKPVLAAMAPGSGTFECTPRHLIPRHYLDPYSAIATFNDCTWSIQWETMLDDLLEYALSNCTIDGSYNIHQMQKVGKQLPVLIEACYLLEARTKQIA